MWSTLKSWFNHSLTILWARITALWAAILSYITIVQGVDISGYMAPKYYPLVLIGIAFLTELARRRTVNEATNQDNRIVNPRTRKLVK